MCDNEKKILKNRVRNTSYCISTFLKAL